MTQYKMLSDDFIGKHRKFMAANSTTMFSKDNSGAHDTVSPQLRRALKQSGVTPDRLRTALKNVGLAFDQMEGEEGAGPDPDHVRRILDCVREALGDAAKSKVAKAIQQRWPESMLESDDDNENDMGEENDDDMTEDDFPSQTEMADADDPPSNPNRNRDYSGRGSEAFRVANDDPPDFPGMPKPGGKMVPQRNGKMAADAALRAVRRVSVDPYPAMMNGDKSPIMAFDSAVENDYERMFGSGSSHVEVL